MTRAVSDQIKDYPENKKQLYSNASTDLFEYTFILTTIKEPAWLFLRFCRPFLQRRV